MTVCIVSKNIKYVFAIILLLFISKLMSEVNTKTKIMTLGVFHFNFPNADVVQTEDSDKISVFQEPYKSEIFAIAKALNEYKPTIIAVELTPNKQEITNQHYKMYKNNKFELSANEIHQLGFRVAKDQNLETIYCIDDFGKHYNKIEEIFNDSLRLKQFENYFLTLNEVQKAPKIESILEELITINNPEYLDSRLSIYLTGLFKYEEKEGDFTGVDFESGRWFNRNLRIFRNIQRIPVSDNDKILLIIGSEHLSILNHLFKVSSDFELISPLQYLNKIK